MSDILAGFVLAAGAGTRLHPLTHHRPKALCPVDNVPLVDLAIARLSAVVGEIAVNVHHHREKLIAHLDGRVHISVEEERPLGTAGGLGFARGWIDGRDVVVINADSWSRLDIGPVLERWERERICLCLAGGGPLCPDSRVVAAMMPWSVVQGLGPETSGLYERCWQPAAEAGVLQIVSYEGPFVDCGSPAGYLRANLLASGGEPVIAPGAVVEGTLTRSVVWDTGRVYRGEHLQDAIRIGSRLTVLVR